MRLSPRQAHAVLVRSRTEAGGFILIAVVVVVLLASMVVVSLLFRLQAEETATAAGAGAEQAWAAAMSGIHEAMRIASKTPVGSLAWHDDPAAFRERLILDEGSERWFFSVYGAGGNDEEESARFGLTAEASKLNINEATEAMLEKLPTMTPYLVQGLLDFLDSDNTPRPEGAEQEYYDALANPYGVANGPLSTVEELLLVRGFTPSLLFGEDANLNFRLDPNEDDAEEQFPPDNRDGTLNAGLRQHLTVWSYDTDTDSQGAPRIDLNAADAALSREDSGSGETLPEPVTAYIQALRRSNVKLGHPAELLEAHAKLKDENGAEVEMDSGVGKAELPIVLDRFTTRLLPRAPGLIDVNTASSQVLQVLPGMDEALADSIVSARLNLRDEQRRTPAWLYQEGLLDASQFKALAPYITARASQFHLHVVGYGVPSGRYRVLEAIVDTAGQKPAIIYLRDITRLGLPFPVRTMLDEEAPASEPSGDLARLPRHPKTAAAALPSLGGGRTGLPGGFAAFTSNCHG